MASERTDLIICGRKIGTFTECDDVGDSETFDGFEPIASVAVPAGCIAIMHELGVIECYDADGNVTHSLDLVDVVRDLPRHEPLAEILKETD
jgi:hypothetical protein